MCSDLDDHVFDTCWPPRVDLFAALAVVPVLRAASLTRAVVVGFADLAIGYRASPAVGLLVRRRLGFACLAASNGARIFS